MKKFFVKIIAVIMTVAIIASAVACSATNNNPSLGKIGRVNIDFARYQSLYNQYRSYSSSIGGATLNTLIKNQLISYGVTLNHCYEIGLELDAEDEAELQNRLNEQIDEAIKNYKVDDSIKDEDAIREAKLDLFKTALKKNGSSYDKYIKSLEADLRESMLMEKLKDQIYSEVSVTDEDVLKYVEEQTAKDEKTYTGKDDDGKDKKDAKPLDDFYTAYSKFLSDTGMIPLYNPEGMFGVKHLLVKFSNADEMQKDEDLKGTFDSEKEEELTKIREALKEGNSTTLEDFEKLIAEHGEDPGMEETEVAEGEEPTINRLLMYGYIMNEEYISKYADGFGYAAMKLYAGHDWEPEKKSDTESTANEEEPKTYAVKYYTLSDGTEVAEVSTTFGVHFIYIQTRLQAGKVTITKDPESDIWNNVHDKYLESKQSEHYNELYADWQKNTKIKLKEKYIDQIAASLFGLS